MKRFTLLLLATALLVSCSTKHKATVDVDLKSAEKITPELVGEWVSPGAKFTGEFLEDGGALYFDADGLAAVVGAPPPIGMVGTATYDSKTFTLWLDLHDGGTPPMIRKMKIVYDPKAKTLTTETNPADGVEAGTFTHRKKEIPKWIRDQAK